MEIITSASNELVKHVNKLNQKKYRDECGEFIVEGYRNVIDTARSFPHFVKRIVMSQSVINSYAEKFKDFSITIVSDAIMKKMSATENSQGILSINVQKTSEMPSNKRCILLDRVRDPGNVGTILRTALAAGYDVVLNNCADEYSPKVVRSAMSAVLKCRIARDLNVSKIKELGYEIIVSDMGGENVFKSKPIVNKYCIVIGNEGDGVCEEIRTVADKTFSIPQNDIESLNAAVAAGIMMYTVANR